LAIAVVIERRFGMDASDILHVVLDANGYHTLYLKSNTVVRFDPASGKVASAVSLPKDEEVERIRMNPQVPTATTHTIRM
jgi:hypothetical protein